MVCRQLFVFDVLADIFAVKDAFTEEMHLGKVREIECILGARLFFEVLSLADDLDGVYHGLHQMGVVLVRSIMLNVPKA